MKLGNLTHQVIVEVLTGRTIEGGEVVEEYVAAFPHNVSLEPLTHSERIRGAAVANDTTHRVTCHYHAAINSRCRFRYGSRIFDIVSIINKGERNREFDITVKEMPNE